MAYIDRIRQSTAFDLSHFRPWRIGAEVVGWINRDLLPRLCAFPGVFEVRADGAIMSPKLADFEARSAALADVVDAFVAWGVVTKRRQEMFPVVTRWGAPPLAAVDRGAVLALGIKAFGVHVNGLVRRSDGVAVWVSRRSADRALDPGKYDHLIAGGQPHGIGIAENIVKESAEEAGLPAAVARTVRPVGAVTYTLEMLGGLRRDTCWVHDLWLDAGFRPHNHDGEVEGFELWPLERVAATVRDTERFKFNVATVSIDLLVRLGYIRPDEPDYIDLLIGLHQPVDHPA
jgi:8-oxo-dGTP pyrophosphatase MutT (NUDIX family)